MLRKVKKVIEEKLISKLSVQLVISFVLMFIIVISIGYVTLYLGVVNILRENSENNSIQQIKQCENNIDTFSDNVDLILSQLVIGSGLSNLTGFSNMSKSDQTHYAWEIISNFRSTLNNYKFIDSIIYYGIDGVIIQSSQFANSFKDDMNMTNDRFHKSEAYQNVMENKQKLTWLGGLTDNDFVSAPVNNTATNKHYLTAVRKTVLSGNLGMLVININMDYFTSIFNNSYSIDSGTIYMVDDTGRIIYSEDKAKLGGKFPDMDSNKDIVTLTITNKNVKEQITYYKLSGFNWIFVSIIPFEVIIKDIVTLRNILILIFLVSLAFALLLSRFWIYKILNPLKKLTHVIKKVKDGNLGIVVEETSRNELGILIHQFNKMSTGISELFKQNKIIEAEKRNLEIETLRWQINPHFIYNTLNTIKWMAIINREENIADSISSLSDFLDPIFKGHNIMCTVKDEISYIQNYVKIMNYRYANGIEYCFNVPEELLSSLIMKFILQPVVENAILHGLTDMVKGRIVITVWSEDLDLFILIEDNGKGINPSKVEEIQQELMEYVKKQGNGNLGVGLVNVNRRIKLQFGDSYGLNIQSQIDKGTNVLLKMPLVLKS